MRDEIDTLVVLGIGGSALGSRAILSALGSGTPRVVVADNVDPWSFGALLDGLDLTRTAFNVVSKSGETAATMAQFLIVRDRLLRALGAIDYKPRVIITTDAEHGSLRQIVNDEGFRDLVVPAGVGGRFSVLTAAGLFPAAVARRAHRGRARRRRVDGQRAALAERCGRTRRICSAALLYLAETRAATAHRRADAVQRSAARPSRAGSRSCGRRASARRSTSRASRRTVGQTPQPAVGATDQHSLLQLYLDGPADKVVLLLRVEDHGREIEIPSAYADLEGVGYLRGKGLGALLNMEQRATELALQQARPPGADAVGAAAQRLHARPARSTCSRRRRCSPARCTASTSWNQPAAEEGRRLTFGLAGRKGWEDRAAEVEAWLASKATPTISCERGAGGAAAGGASACCPPRSPTRSPPARWSSARRRW